MPPPAPSFGTVAGSDSGAVSGDDSHANGSGTDSGNDSANDTDSGAGFRPDRDADPVDDRLGLRVIGLLVEVKSYVPRCGI